MNTIKSYVDTMFINLPETKELLSVKNEILANMEEKYDELILDGLSENEAIGMVISEFGNIDELLNELNIKEKNKFKSERELPVLSTEDINDYMAMKREVGFGIGLGVFLSGLAVSIILFGLYRNSFVVGVTGGTLVSALAVSLFIINGIKHSKFDYLEKGFLLKQYDIRYIELEKKKYEKSFYVSLVIGVSLCIISLIPIIIGIQNADNILIYVAGTIILAAIGFFFFIYGGNISGGFTYLLENGLDESLTEDELSAKLFWKKFNDNFWLVVVAIYLLISFAFNSWGYSWIIFPVAVVLSGVRLNNKE